MSTQNHFFIAIPLPEYLIEEMSIYLKELKNEFAFTRWVHPEDLHITLAFLGAGNEEKLAEIKDSMTAIAQDASGFSLKMSGLGTFGNPQSPRIFWHGIVESAELNLLRDRVYEACEKIGFDLDRRSFHPHITLARKWQGPAFQQYSALSDQARTDTFKVKEFVLYQTHLHKLPKYEKIGIFPLKQE
ncbi:RNA 2',3'-cyclic phosphodiesterase [Bacillus tianshenii]|uniref:RNA 2',3'-cyclic phosphodiesterase n=1 Tax=Sutcliffiella tianshenii TaxID=1463404 RepID=UPI001CD41CE8|nr:RNA 2',3'-cyclic phosphodiesterase [Bacillus tianshenii]MCA1319937.1 RNA 2',3'-cyclic phosphodiesterase [Bacillus tianshenii]